MLSKEMLIIIALLLFVVMLALLLLREISKLHKRLNALLNNSDNSNIEDTVRKIYEEIGSKKETINRNDSEIKELQIKSKDFFNKFSLINYNAFGDMGGNMSFVLCMLNSDNNGILLNSLHSRAGTRLYSKPIVCGKFDGTLSEEESKALKEAIDKEI